jgi:hypothetical protein
LRLTNEEYETLTKDELKNFSPNQLRVWRNNRMRAAENFVSVVGEKPVNELTVDDAIDYTDWRRERVTTKNVAVKSANNREWKTPGRSQPYFRIERSQPYVPIERRAESPD